MDYKGRIDIRVEGSKFNLSYVKAGGTANNLQLSKADWLLSGDQEKHWFVEGNLEEKWSNIYVEFISGGTGEISLEFRGGWFNDLAENHHDIWMTDIDFEGKGMINSDFSKTDEDGNVVGWGGSKVFSDETKDSRSNKRSVLIWHDEPVVQRIPVAAGKKYKVSVWFKPNVV